MNKPTMIFLFAMYTVNFGCSVSMLPTQPDGSVVPANTTTLDKFSIIITSNDLQADRSLVMDVLTKANILIVELKEWPLDGMRGEFNVICKGDTKRIDELRNDLLLTGQVSKVSISRQY